MPRPIQSVTLAFGLVSIPVRLYTAAASKRVRFHWLDSRTGQRVQQQLVSPSLGSGEDIEEDRTDIRAARAAQFEPVKNVEADSAVVPREELRKGFEVATQDYVSLRADELKALELETNENAEIQEFVPVTAVPPAYIEKAYYLGPDKGREKVYRLLARALQKKSYGAIAKIVMRGKEKVVFVRPMGGERLLMELLYFADEVRDVNEIVLPEAGITDAELRLAEQVVGSMANENWDATQYRDTYRERVLALIEEKRLGRPVKHADRRKAEPVIDLMDALKRSLKDPRSLQRSAISPASTRTQRKRRAG
jgi:DNA end-binding protein Ku